MVYGPIKRKRQWLKAVKRLDKHDPQMLAEARGPGEYSMREIVIFRKSSLPKYIEKYGENLHIITIPEHS